MNREGQAAQSIIIGLAAKAEKQQTIKYLTDLMATIQAAYFKGRMEGHPLLVHERTDGSVAISIDLYNFEGDGEPVCAGLKPCTITYDDGSSDTGWLFCMCYDPDDVTPLTFLYDYDSDADPMELDPEDVPEEVLHNITAWLEKAMQPVPQEKKKEPTPEDIISLWSDWCMDYDDENLWLDYMAKHPKAHCNRRHLQEKWDSCYKQYGNKAAMTMFWRQLDNTNRTILTEYITEVWHKE